MKKITFSLFLCLSVGLVPAWAQFSGRHSKLPLLEEEVHRAVAAREVPTWQEQLSRLQIRFKQAPGTYRAQPVPPPLAQPEELTYQQAPTYRCRLLRVQASVDHNAALKGFTFVAPVPADLARLTADNYAALHAFLKDLKIVQVRRTECDRPFTLALRITGQNRSALEVWVDVPSKKMYLMSDNFYTTAAGKYGLDWK